MNSKENVKTEVTTTKASLPVLSYHLSYDPHPVQISLENQTASLQALTIVVSNPTINMVTAKKVEFRLRFHPDDARALASEKDSINTQAPAEWNPVVGVERDGSADNPKPDWVVFTFRPQDDELDIAPEGFVFKIYNIPVNLTVGNADFQIREETIEEGRRLRGKKDLLIPKFPLGFDAGDFRAVAVVEKNAPPGPRPHYQVAHGKKTTLRWAGSERADYWIFYNESEGQAPVRVNVGDDNKWQWLTPALTKNTVFTLRVNPITDRGVQPVYRYFSLIISVVKPDLLASSLTVDGIASASTLVVDGAVQMGPGNPDDIGPFTIRSTTNYSGLTLYKGDREAYSAKMGQEDSGGYLFLQNEAGKRTASIRGADGHIQAKDLEIYHGDFSSYFAKLGQDNNGGYLRLKNRQGRVTSVSINGSNGHIVASTMRLSGSLNSHSLTLNGGRVYVNNVGNSNCIQVFNSSSQYPAIASRNSTRRTGNWITGTLSFVAQGSDWGFGTNGRMTTNAVPGLFGGVTTSKGTRVATSPIVFAIEIHLSGSGVLQNGKVKIKLDEDIADVIVCSKDKPYRVLITPTGMCNGLCVTARDNEGFEVQELQKGNSNVAFDWLIIAAKASELGTQEAEPMPTELPDYDAMAEEAEEPQG